jgi:hypothetical protein
MATANKIERVSFETIIDRPDFQTLTSAQRVWLKVYLIAGDAVKATRIAYPKTSAASMASRVCHVKSHPVMRKILNAAFGEPENPLEPMLGDLRRAIRKSIKRDNGLTSDTMQAIRFYERQTGRKIGKANGR